MEKLRKSSLLKIIGYIIIPILVAILGLSMLHLVFLNEFGSIKEEVQYSQTENFANNYFYYFIEKIAECQNLLEDNNEIKLQDAQGKSYYYLNEPNLYQTIGGYISYIIVDRQTR